MVDEVQEVCRASRARLGFVMIPGTCAQSCAQKALCTKQALPEKVNKQEPASLVCCFLFQSSTLLSHSPLSEMARTKASRDLHAWHNILGLMRPAANRPQVHRWQGPPQAARCQGRPQVGPLRRRCQEAPSVSLHPLLFKLHGLIYCLVQLPPWYRRPARDPSLPEVD